MTFPGAFTRRNAILALVATAAASRPALSRADDYPSRPVKIIAPFGAGGPADVFIRALAQELQNALRQSFVVENHPGAGTTIGTELVAQSAPDGYTLLLASSTQTVNETLYKNKPYALLRDLLPVSPIEQNDLVLVVNPSVPAHTVAELIALAKAKPGTLNFGSSGPGSNYHMAAELLKNLTGINIVHVPYKGSTGMRVDILSGQIQILFELDPHDGGLCQSRQSASARHHRHGPFANSAPYPDHRRNRPRLRVHPMGRPDGAQSHAAAHRRPAARHDR